MLRINFRSIRNNVFLRQLSEDRSLIIIIFQNHAVTSEYRLVPQITAPIFGSVKFHLCFKMVVSSDPKQDSTTIYTRTLGNPSLKSFTQFKCLSCPEQQVSLITAWFESTIIIDTGLRTCRPECIRPPRNKIIQSMLIRGQFYMGAHISA